MAKIYEDPGPLPDGATPAEKKAWMRKNELYATEGFKPIGRSKVDPTDSRLRELRRDHQQFMAMHSPMKAALWLALSLPAKDVLHKDEMKSRYIAAQKGELEDGQEFVAPEELTIVELANTWAAAGLRGDLTAVQSIAERIEGKTGLRKDDIDPEDPKQRQQLHAVTESLVAALTKAALSNVPGDKAKVIDVEAVDKGPKEE
jgi:hypothetical protein